jgi:cell division cycle 2-like protein
MSGTAKSRWAEDDAETEAAITQRKAEKEAKKRAKAERQRKLEEAAQKDASADGTPRQSQNGANGDTEPPAKRRRLSNETAGNDGVVEMEKPPSTLLRFPSMPWGPCRHVDNFEKLNHIEEGSYGWVSRAKETATGEIIALKKLKMEYSYDGFPVTGLREIETLLDSRHTNIVRLREIVLGDKMDE